MASKTETVTTEMVARAMAKAKDQEAAIEKLIERHGEGAMRAPLRAWAAHILDGRRRAKARRLVGERFPVKRRMRNKALAVLEKDRVALCVRHIAEQGDAVEVFESSDEQGPIIILRKAKQ